MFSLIPSQPVCFYVLYMRVDIGYETRKETMRGRKRRGGQWDVYMQRKSGKEVGEGR